MSKDEFFAFMPLLIYGIAVSELAMHWRDYLKKDRRYWPHLITGLLMLEVAFYNFYFLYDKLEFLFVNYNHFLFRLSSPIILLLAVSVYTPEPERNVKEYFLDKIPTLFSLLALFIFMNMMQEFTFGLSNIIRVIFIVLLVTIAITKSLRLLYLVAWIRLTFLILISAFPDSFTAELL